MQDHIAVCYINVGESFTGVFMCTHFPRMDSSSRFVSDSSVHATVDDENNTYCLRDVCSTQGLYVFCLCTETVGSFLRSGMFEIHICSPLPKHVEHNDFRGPP